jgi:uncharacterized membrane protein
LIAGLFYAYSCSVNLGLRELSDTQYVAAMQSINRAIQNPAFFLSFMGTLLLLPVCTYVHYGQPYTSRFLLLLSATLIYAIGVFGVTMFINVPLNEALDKFNAQNATAEAINQARNAFEKPWNQGHFVRTIASFIALVLTVLACVSRDNQ